MHSLVYGLIILIGFLDFMFFIFFSFTAFWAGWEYWVKKRNGFTYRIFHVSAASAGKFLVASIRNFMLIMFWQLINPVAVLTPLTLTVIVQVWLGVSYIGIVRELLFVIEEPDVEPDKSHDSPVESKIKKHL